MDASIPMWAYMVAAGGLFTLAQQLIGREVARLDKRLDALESGLREENSGRRDAIHKHAAEIQSIHITLAKQGAPHANPNPHGT